MAESAAPPAVEPMLYGPSAAVSPDPRTPSISNLGQDVAAWAWGLSAMATPKAVASTTANALTRAGRKNRIPLRERAECADRFRLIVMSTTSLGPCRRQFTRSSESRDPHEQV